MGIYIGLIIYILLLPILVTPFCRTAEKKRNAIAFLGLAAIFIILALKGETVGYDIAGYKEQYYLSANKSWFDVGYIYFEPGYLILTKIFSKIGADFQFFMAVVYALACSSMYFFIKKYSKNPMLSLIIFVGYQFFVFYISGVRQTIAMSLCLIAYMVFKKRNIWAYISSFLIVLLAMSMHTSAILFIPVLIFSYIKSKNINVFVWGGIIIASVILRPFVWEIVNRYFREVDVNTEITLAGNFIFLCGVAVMMYFINAHSNVLSLNFKYNDITDEEDSNNVFYTRMLLFSVCTQILFSGHSLLRAAMYPMAFIITGLPNTTHRLNPKLRLMFDYVFVVFFIALFYFDTLVPSQFGICPYVFFWQ